MKVGNIQIDSIDTGQFVLDGGSMFGVIPKTLWSKAYHPGDERNRIPLAARPLLLQFDNYKILIDTGNGIKYDEKKIDIYNFDIDKSNPDNYLKRFNLTRSDITHVILTHLHFDHCGGATILHNGKLEPTFPNAKYYVQKEQFEHALNPTEKDAGSFFKDNYVPLQEFGMLELLEGDGELFPNISIITTKGHTPSMQMVKITSSDETLLYVSDLIPTSSYLRYTYIPAFDNHPLITLEEKKKFLPKIFDEGWIVVLEHDMKYQACTIKPDDKGKGFVVDKEVVITE
ncbi:MAG TPA: MBL fold metallo-hydrolase [Candidatus Kapabacteria bacterium]|nr:MBL fold metallo-hydrolase [Candidatus Kapabacteria bacterium]